MSIELMRVHFPSHVAHNKDDGSTLLFVRLDAEDRVWVHVAIPGAQHEEKFFFSSVAEALHFAVLQTYAWTGDWIESLAEREQQGVPAGVYQRHLFHVPQLSDLEQVDLELPQ